MVILCAVGRFCDILCIDDVRRTRSICVSFYVVRLGGCQYICGQ